MNNGWQDRAPLNNLLVPGFFDRSRPIQLGIPFWSPMTIPFTGVANENQTGQTTANYNTEILIHGAVSDLNFAQIQMSLPGTLPQLWSQSPVAISTLAADPDSARPVMRYPYPLPLAVGRFVSAQALNVQGEGEGTLVFVCEQPTDGPTSLDPKRLGPMEIIPVDSQFTGTAGEQTTSAGVLTVVDYDFLLLGFYSDLNLATIQIIDIQGRQWMNGSNAPGQDNRCPVWAFAGRATSQIRVKYLPRAYFVPAQQMPQFNFTNDSTNPEDSGSLYMFGQRLLD